MVKGLTSCGLHQGFIQEGYQVSGFHPGGGGGSGGSGVHPGGFWGVKTPHSSYGGGGGGGGYPPQLILLLPSKVHVALSST